GRWRGGSGRIGGHVPAHRHAAGFHVRRHGGLHHERATVEPAKLSIIGILGLALRAALHGNDRAYSIRAVRRGVWPQGAEVRSRSCVVVWRSSSGSRWRAAAAWISAPCPTTPTRRAVMSPS